MVGKIYARILVDRVRRVTVGLMDDDQGVFRAGREKERRVYVGFIELEKGYDRVNREA